MKLIVQELLINSAQTIHAIAEKNTKQIVAISKAIIEAYKNDKKVLIFGNGGSASDAQHMAAELVGRFKKERKAYPAIALTTNTSTLTALANDYSYEYVFERQIDAFAAKGDIVIGISTSGQAKNVISGLKKAKAKGAFTIGLTGERGINLKKITDICLMVPSDDTARIQESHITIIHIICKLVEDALSK
ncbi:MAG: D-sedoheptulose 7-phosphate isomerase [Candidatus Omnitrophica bacterium]|nr:D-sedoheptulose 7-phosphate isomerase [Candidatus Omnitrophota bacterium]